MAQFNKEVFKEDYRNFALDLFGKEIEDCNAGELYESLAKLVLKETTQARTETSLRHNELQEKKVYYLSMEFLIGKLLENYLINMGLRDEVANALSEMNIDFEALCHCEDDPGLGNGGLGRLAACFLDSMAATGVPGVGMGLRFRFGLFRQKIDNGYQIEEPDDWLCHGYPWETQKPNESVVVRFGGEIEKSFEDGKLNFKHKNYESVLAVPYDVPIVGWQLKDVNNLRLWRAMPLKETVDMDAFNHGNYAKAMKERADIDALTCILYPNDNQESGKVLRIKQEYLLVSASIESILKKYVETYGEAWEDLPQHVSIHTNDTHPALAVPELMRRLVDDKGLEWDDAWKITTQVISFTNHTVMPEALEKWPQDMLRRLLPRIYMIIEEIDRRWKESLHYIPGNWQEMVSATEIFHDGTVRMAQLSIIGSHSVNGVAALHSDILKNSLFKSFYTINPEMFNNKTNGISQRRFLIQANPSLTNLISDALNCDDWKYDMQKMEGLLKYESDPFFLEKLGEVKRQNKVKLAKYIADTQHIEINPDSIFDIQVKRIHAYKRQILNAFKVLELYNEIKENPNKDIPPYTFIFAGKSAPGYEFAKESIKFVCSVADLVNSDPVVSKKIKVVFIENFCVSNAQIIYPAAEISEQISTAGKEASGTGNMKFMMNGAITLGTMDGANVEIHNLVGDNNMMIFGLSSDETENYFLHGGYSAKAVMEADERLTKIVSQLVDGTFDRSGKQFWGIYDALLQQNDEYFVLKDFDSYMDAFNKLSRLYGDKEAWNRMSLVNIAKSYYFSSDRTIREYANEIWHAPCK